jgi:hypothetical protein
MTPKMTTSIHSCSHVNGEFTTTRRDVDADDLIGRNASYYRLRNIYIESYPLSLVSIRHQHMTRQSVLNRSMEPILRLSFNRAHFEAELGPFTFGIVEAIKIPYRIDAPFG